MDEDDLPHSFKPRSVWIEVGAVVLVVCAFVALAVTIILAIQAGQTAR